MSNFIDRYNRARANRKEKAERAFWQKQKRANELIAQLQAHLSRSAAEVRTHGGHWGHCGDVDHVIEQLEILNQSWELS